jgi:hypothetical protein
MYDANSYRKTLRLGLAMSRTLDDPEGEGYCVLALSMLEC